MTKKTFLSKVLPAALVFILVILLVVVISSCSRSKKTPTEGIQEVDDYISVTLSNGEKVTVSKTKFYDNLRYIGYNTFAEELDSLIFADYVKAIEDDLDANSSNLANSKYYDKFVDYINETTYGTSDEDEIADLTSEEKTKMEKKFASTLAIDGTDFDLTKGIYQRSTFDYYVTQLARAEYARSVLAEKVVEVDGEYEITDDDISAYFKENVSNKDDVSAIIVIFSSATEINAVLKALKLKFVKDKLYRVAADPEESDYDVTYSNFTVTSDGISHLEDNEILFEFAHIYNYMYSTYRPGLTLSVNVDITDDATDNPTEIELLESTSADSYVSPLLNGAYTSAQLSKIYAAIKNTYSVEELTSIFLAQDKIKTGNEDDPKLTFNYDDLNKYDTTLCSDVYNKYLADSTDHPANNTSASSSSNGKYLVYKLVDSVEVTYENVKTMSEFVDAVANNNAAASINQYIQQLSEIFEGRLKALDIFGDKDKTKEYFYGNGSTTGFANEIIIDGIVGAKNYLEKAWDKEDEESAYNKVFDGRLTDEYINTVVSEYMEDECEILIYDELFEVQFASKNDFYETTNKQSSDNVASVQKGENIVYLTSVDMFNILEKRFGGNEALKIVSNQILKDKYYDQLEQEDLESFDQEYESTLTYFATGQSDSYGYPASIGQKAFIQLYFRADNKEDAIFNMWVSEKLQKLCVLENPTDLYENIYDKMRDLTIMTYEDYVNLSYQSITIYTDDDEDGKRDDWTLVEDSNERKLQVKKAAAELMDVITSRLATYGSSVQNESYESIVQDYNNASRISTNGFINDGNPVPDLKTLEEKDSYIWGKFKQLGLFIYAENTTVDTFDALEALDDNKIDQLINIYQWFKGSNLLIDGSLASAQTFARKVVLDEDKNIIGVGDKADAFNEADGSLRGDLCATIDGFTIFNVYGAKKAPSAQFLFGDNANDSVNGKLYPYSIDQENAFPKDDEGNPINSYTDENTLYNENDDATSNQIQIYVREYLDGVESLSSSVTDALKTFFDAKVYSNFISSSFNYVICEKLINQYMEDGKVSFKNEELYKSIERIVDSQKETVFDFETNDFTEAWWETFN